MKHLKVVLIGITACILTSFFTFCVTNALLMNKKSSPVNKKEKATDIYSASLSFSRVYKKCNHTITDSSSGTTTFSSTEELLNRFPGYKITSGEGEEIVLSSEIDDFCPYHYKAHLTDSEIVIKRLCDQEKITSFKIIPHTLSSSEKSLLEQGITLNSQKALTAFIEDFTS